MSPVAHYLGLLSGALGRLEWAERDFEAAVVLGARLCSPRWQVESLLAHASLLAGTTDLERRLRAVQLVRTAAGLCERMTASSLATRVAELLHISAGAP